MNGQPPPRPSPALRGSEIPLVLGGHSFIAQLGNDTPAAEREQAEIVGACLDQGIRWFDTTYQPERAALGRALKRLGGRGEATIIAWNFFKDFGPGEDVGGPSCYQPHHIEAMLEQLQTDHIDCLVVHALPDPEENNRQEELAIVWQSRGYVGQLGTWHPGPDAEASFGPGNPYRFMVRPYNVTTNDAAPAFAAAKRLGWQTLACSPFVRGWELDRLVQNAVKLEPGEANASRARLADHMLRYSLFQQNVDRLIVSIRRLEWVARNAASARAGPLSNEELTWLCRAALA